MLLEQNRDWARPALALVAAGAFCLIYAQTVSDLLNLWMREGNPTYSHGPLLLLVCGVLAYKKGKAARLSLMERPNPLGLLLVFGLSLTWLAAALVQVQIVQYLCLVFLLLALFYTLFGVESFRVYGLPILLLLFSIPLWEVFNGLLQWLTIVWVEFLLNASGIPAVSSGIIIEVPAGMFRVEDSCSGLGQFIVAGAVAVIFADTLKLNFLKTLFVVAAALAVAVFSNIVRVYIVVVAGQMTQMQHSLLADHYVLGWALFGSLFFAFLFVLAKRFRYSGGSNALPRVSPPANEHTRVFLPRSLLLVTIPCLVALTGPALLSILNSTAEAEEHAEVSLPAEIGSWKRISTSVQLWQTRFSGYDYSENGHYSGGAGDVELIVYQYVRQQQGKEAVTDGNLVYENFAEPLGRRVVNFNGGDIYSVQEHLFRLGARKQLVWHWYQTAGLGTGSPWIAKLLGVWGRLINEPAVTVFIVTSDATRSVDAAHNRLKDFVDALPTVTLTRQK